MATDYFNIIDIAVSFISFLTFVLTVGTDLYVCTELLLVGQVVWGWLMMAFIAMPMVVMSTYSLTWHIHDKTVTSGVIVSHLLLLAPVERYLKVIILGVRSYRSQKAVHLQEALKELSDVSVLRLIEAFLESAPLLVLQMYISVCEGSRTWLIGVSAGCSLVSLTWAMTVFSDTQRRTRNTSCSRHFVRLGLHWGWQLFMTAARIAAFVFFACALEGWMFACMGGHWLLALLWISVKGTDYGTGCKKWLFRLVCAFIYIFVFLNLNDGKSRWRISCYYLLVLLENTAMLSTFLVLGSTEDMVISSCLVVFVGFFLGLACMLIYYTFFHPSGPVKRVKRLLRPQTRTFNISGLSHETGVQIFSIESPKTVKSAEEVSAHLTATANGSQSLAPSLHQTAMDESTGSARRLNSAGMLSKATLQKAWQNGLESTSGSSLSSLASLENASYLGKRTSSVKSNSSHGSASSNNQLLPHTLVRNSPCDSPKKTFSHVVDMGYVEQGVSEDNHESDNMNIATTGSLSPPHSRDLSSRSSNQNRQSLALGDLASFSIDGSSSSDKRASDYSSFSNQQKVLSPLDVSNLWKDTQSRLRATIAATIAAMVGNLSTSESTPANSRSVSSAVSAQDDSLNSTHYVTTLSHNTAFMDSGSSYREKSGTSQQAASQDSFQHQEALNCLSGITEASNLGEVSEFRSRKGAHEKPVERNATENRADPDSDVADLSRARSSLYFLDSTLTVSHLGIQQSNSYITSQKRQDPGCRDPHVCEEPCSPEAVSVKSPLECPRSLQASDNRERCKGDSPFTDQELITVMTQSLQSYICGNSSVHSSVTEREGLALTLEDLCLSPESTPEKSPASPNVGDTCKKEAELSICHDSTDSSPASSASKMNRMASVQNAEAKLSPNAFKQLEISPQGLHILDSFLLIKQSQNQTVTAVPKSNALKFIMDSYKSAAQTDQCSTTPKPRRSFSQEPSNSVTPKSKSASNLCLQSLKQETPSASRHSKYRHSMEEDLYPIGSNGHGKSRCVQESPATWKRSDITAQSLKVSEQTKQPEARGGVSSTKKLAVLFKGSAVSEDKSSLNRKQAQPENQSDSGSEMGEYVAGEYRPPLCGDVVVEFGQYCTPLCGDVKVNSEENSVQRNLNHVRRDMKQDLSNVSKLVHELFSEDQQKLDRINIGPNNLLPKEVIRENSEFRKQKHFTRQPSKACSNEKLQLLKAQAICEHNSPAVGTGDLNKDEKRPNKSKTITQSHNMDKLTEAEQNMQAQHVADYFTKYLEHHPSMPSYCSRPKRYSHPQLQVHSCRQPLQQLENSQCISPDAKDCTPKGRRNGSSRLQNGGHQRVPKCTISPHIYQDKSSRGFHRHYSNHTTDDFPKAKLLSECAQSASKSSPKKPSRMCSRPLINKLHKASTKLQFDILTDDQNVSSLCEQFGNINDK